MTEPQTALSDDVVVRLFPAFEEAARASQGTVDRFIAPRVGIVEQAMAGRHQFILGRRGVGKSTLLRKIESEAGASGNAITFIDLETLRGIPYPDVLLHLLIELLGLMEGRLKAHGRRVSLRRMRSRRVASQVARLRSELQLLLSEPQSAEIVVKRLRSHATEVGGSVGMDIGIRDPQTGVGVNASASASSGTSTEAEDAAESRFKQTKMEGLYASATQVREVIGLAMDQLSDTTGYIALDDFHHVPFTDQPKVLSYLHQVVKNIDVWLKIGAVRHRLNPFVEGDPPIGLQLGHDASALSLDVTLEQFDLAKRFLEDILAGVCDPLGIDPQVLATDTGATRLVLASGGVARDYLSLARIALRASNERVSYQARPHNRITAEDVNEASKEISTQKEEDLLLDSGPNAENLRSRLDALAEFCLDVNQTNVFLVDATKLREQEWGRQIQALADLRLVHDIGALSVQTASYRGRAFRGFTLDLSTYTVTRAERIRQIEFWTSEGRQSARRAALIYDPMTEVTRRSDAPPEKASCGDTEMNPRLFDA